MQQLTQEDIDIKKEILMGSYFENHSFAKTLHHIKSKKSAQQWHETRKILNEFLTLKNKQ